MRRGPSPLRDRDQVIAAWAGSATKLEILEKLGLRAAGGNYAALDKALLQFDLPIPDASRGGLQNLRDWNLRPSMPDAEFFSASEKVRGSRSTKKRLLLLGWPYRCAKCEVGALWQGQSLTLQIDHINGDRKDHRLDNLRFLCPNCHSQTATFCGRKLRLPKVRAYKPRPEKSKIVWPEDDDLVEMLKGTSVLAASKTLGVSDNAIHKRLKVRGLVR